MKFKKSAAQALIAAGLVLSAGAGGALLYNKIKQNPVVQPSLSSTKYIVTKNFEQNDDIHPFDHPYNTSPERRVSQFHKYFERQEKIFKAKDQLRLKYGGGM